MSKVWYMVNNMLIVLDWLSILVDKGENKGYAIQTDQVWFGNSIPGHGGPKKRITCFCRGRKKIYDSEAFVNFPAIFLKWSHQGAHYFLFGLFQLLYTFRATMCPLSGERIVSMRQWYFSLCVGGYLVGMRLGGCPVCWLGWDWVAVWCAGWDETGWLCGVLVGMRLGGCPVCWLGWDWVVVWSAGSDETGWLCGVLVGMRLCGCVVCWLGWD